MEEQSKIEELSDQLKAYIDTRYDLIVLHTSDKVSNLGSQFIAYITIGVLSLLCLVLLSIALSLYVSELTHSMVAGFLSAAGFYFILTLFLIVFKKQFAAPFRNKIIRAVLNESA